MKVGIVPLPEKLPKPTYEEMRSSRFLRKIDDLTINFGVNPPPINARGMILHVSDTPSQMFPFLKRTVERLHPAWVIHTGDLVDDLKLENNRMLLPLYRKKVKRLLGIFKELGVPAILVMGNHDDLSSVLDNTADSGLWQVWSTSGRCYLGGVTLMLGHKYEDVASGGCRYNLYGHSAEHRTRFTGRSFFLNGIEHMHLIDMESGDVTQLRYPPGTKESRLSRRQFSF